MIALATVPHKFPVYEERILPLGLGYLSSYLKLHDISSLIFDFHSFPVSIRKSIELILKYKPELVGFSCSELNYFIAREYCREIKKKDPDVKTALGGPAPTLAYIDILNDNDFIDFCVVGEGEQTLLELYKNLTGTKEDLLNTRGLAVKQQDEVIFTGPRSLISDLDSIPSPFKDEIFDMKYYHLASISAGRGCPMQCIFCACREMFDYVRYHSSNRILEEIDYIYDLNERIDFQKMPQLFGFSDDALTISREHVNEILDGLEERNYDVKWSAVTRIDHITKELLVRMKDTGLVTLNVALESADPFILTTLKKVKNLEMGEEFIAKFEKFLEWVQELKISVSAGIILGNPLESYEHARKTVDFCTKYANNPWISWGVTILTPYCNTDLFRNHKDFSMEIQKDNELLLPYKVKKFSEMDFEEIASIGKQIPDSKKEFFGRIWNNTLTSLKKVNAKSRFRLFVDDYYDIFRRDYS